MCYPMNFQIRHHLKSLDIKTSKVIQPLVNKNGHPLLITTFMASNLNNCITIVLRSKQLKFFIVQLHNRIYCIVYMHAPGAEITILFY